MSDKKSKAARAETTPPPNGAEQEASGQQDQNIAAGESSSGADAVAAELAESQEKYLRLAAEMENLRRRARRELDDELKYANQHLLRDLLPVVDNIGRGISAAEKNADAATLLDGFKMLAQQFESVLSKYHCQRINAAGQPFDPHRHAAIMQQPTADSPPDRVLNVAQEGYVLHDRVLRPAQVIVSCPPPQETSAAE